MFRFARAIAFAVALATAFTGPAGAQVTIITPDLGARVNPETFSVTLNGADVSAGSTLYVSQDGTVYASLSDLTAWGLSHPAEPAFTADDVRYYGLQTQLELAVSVRRPQERLEIVAPPTAFLGGPDRVRGPLAGGRGAFLNYKIDKTTGAYKMFYTHDSSGLEVDYGSMQSSNSLSFARALTSIYNLDVDQHRLIELGEGSIDAGDIGTSSQYVGLHLASEFKSDPLFVSHALPSVSGVAASPSTLEVYVDNVLQWREEVPAGPFVVRDLPPSAASADVLLVLTDAFGRRTTEIVRPSRDQGLLRPGLTSYNLDAGWGQDEFMTRSPRYGPPVASATLRHGITPWLTLQGLGETLDGESFAALGFEARPGFGQEATFWYGDGKIRRTGSLNYTLREGRIGFSERMKFNAESTMDEFNPGGVFSRFSETRELSFDPSSAVSLRLRLDRSVTDTSTTAVYSLEAGLRVRTWSLSLRPSYDRIAHVVSATVELTQRFGDIHELRETVDRPAGRQAGTTYAYQKSSRDQDDPWTVRARVATGATDTKELALEDKTSWADLRAQAQDQNGQGLTQAEISGSLQAVGGTVAALREDYDQDVVGIARLPGFPGVRIDVNGSPAGYTNAKGNVLLPRLAALQENTITADLAQIPLAVGVRDPVVIEPYPGAPVTIDLLEPQAQTYDLVVSGADGKSLPPATYIVAEDGTRFPIGLDGRAFIRGLQPGAHTFKATDPRACSFSLTFAPRWEIVDGGRVACR